VTRDPGESGLAASAEPGPDRTATEQDADRTAADAEASQPVSDPESELVMSGRWILGIVIAVGAARAAYDVLVGTGLDQTAALYIGIPVIIASILGTLVHDSSCLRLSLIATSIALLLGVLILPEAGFCIALAAPVMLGAAALFGALLDRLDARPDSMHAGLLAVALLSLEGTHPALDLPRHETVIAAASVPGSPADIERALTRSARFDRPVPALLSVGFPQPVTGSGSPLAVGERYTTEFAGGGELLLEIVESSPGRVVYRPIRHTTPVAGWLELKLAVVTWHQDDTEGHTHVEWSLSYDRQLDPYIYFAPLERAAVGLTAAYLIDSVATP
jgi:hypothetical protein